jgi:ubiquinone/menaquinone biosynthesis C-methylase UbiE
MNYEKMLKLKSKLGHFDAGVLLDVAVGRGDFLKFVLDSFQSWQSAAGIDNDPESLEIATCVFEGTPVILVLDSALSMPFTNQYFDTVTLSNTLHHIEALPSLFSEISRISKPKSNIIINEMINEEFSEIQETYMLYHRLVADIDNQRGLYHHEPFSLKELETLIKTSNFKILDYFVHSEITGDAMDGAEIEALAQRLNRKVAMLHGSDYYYFFANKAREVIHRLQKTGIYRPRHITFILQVS